MIDHPDLLAQIGMCSFQKNHPPPFFNINKHSSCHGPCHNLPPQKSSAIVTFRDLGLRDPPSQQQSSTGPGVLTFFAWFISFSVGDPLVTFGFYFPLLMLRGHPTKLKCWHFGVPQIICPNGRFSGEVTYLCKGIVEGISKLLEKHAGCELPKSQRGMIFGADIFFARKIDLGDFQK